MKLYRFEGPEDFRIETLMRNEIRMSRPDKFNDPFDCQPMIIYDEYSGIAHEQNVAALKIMYEHYKAETGSWLIDSELVAAIYSWCDGSELSGSEYLIHLLKRKVNSFGVQCFSKSGFDSPTMWAYYASNHKGFCVEYEYNPSELRFKSNYDFVMNPVVYTSEPQTVDLMQILANPRLAAGILTTYKTADWSNEQEMRLVYFPMLGASDNGLNVRLPPGLKVSAIYAGLEAKNILAKLECAANIHQVNLYQMNKDANELDAHPVITHNVFD